MTSRAFTLVFVLLGSLVISVLGLQAFWMYNFYHQRSLLFDGNVYAALDDISEKLREKEQIRIFREGSYVIRQRKDHITRSVPRRVILRNPDSRNKEIKIIGGRNKTIIQHSKEIRDSILRRNTEYEVIIERSENELMRASRELQKLDTSLKNLNINLKDLELTGMEAHQTSNSSEPDIEEMENLLDKMMTEIKFPEGSERNKDTLQNLIRRVLHSKGIFTPFQFAIKSKRDTAEKIILSSTDFNWMDKSYQGDLSLKKLIDTKQFLLLQFDKKEAAIIKGMRNSLILSLLFSLLIIGSFYYTIKLLRRQKKISDVKNDFVNNMTHELKTPIATISLALDAMNNPQISKNEEKLKNYTRILKEENQKLNSHVERVLQMSLLDKGELHLKKERVHLDTIIENAIQNYQLQIIEAGADIQLRSAPDLPIITGDPEHLTSVFNNLIDNSLKYSAGKCRIDIELNSIGPNIQVKFHDNGIGIDASQRDKIFEKFYRVQGGNLHDIKGFGLGLSYVKSIIEAHGGKIIVEGTLGKGSTFKILF